MPIIIFNSLKNWFLNHSYPLGNNITMFFYKLDKTGVSRFAEFNSIISEYTSINNKPYYITINKNEIYITTPNIVNNKYYADHFTIGQNNWNGTNNIINKTNFDYIYFHKSIQFPQNSMVKHIHAWFLDNYLIPNLSLQSTNNIDCFYKNNVFKLYEATDEDKTINFSPNDLLIINNIFAYPISVNYMGGKNKIGGSSEIIDYIKLTGKTIFNKCLNLQSLKIICFVDNNTNNIHFNIFYNDDTFDNFTLSINELNNSINFENLIKCQNIKVK
jgi:hypothetical protein